MLIRIMKFYIYLIILKNYWFNDIKSILKWQHSINAFTCTTSLSRHLPTCILRDNNIESIND